MVLQIDIFQVHDYAPSPKIKINDFFMFMKIQPLYLLPNDTCLTHNIDLIILYVLESKYPLQNT